MRVFPADRVRFPPKAYRGADERNRRRPRLLASDKIIPFGAAFKSL